MAMFPAKPHTRKRREIDWGKVREEVDVLIASKPMVVGEQIGPITVTISERDVPSSSHSFVGPQLSPEALRGWLLAFCESIGDSVPDLAQWRRLREEVGRSVGEKKIESPVMTGADLREVGPVAPSPVDTFPDGIYRSKLLDALKVRVRERQNDLVKNLFADYKIPTERWPEGYNPLTGLPGPNLCNND